ncbi:MAG: hypothetical protein PHO15_04840 [Eubacteriales bacterium]|nr:hypothetical protein [Eubacteriales bacterium]
MVELERGHSGTDLEKNQDLNKNFQTAILLSLLEDKKITRWQFDRCIGEHKGIMTADIGRIKKDDV